MGCPTVSLVPPTDHLANERTFLAWLRTGLSLLGLGFVVAKFGLWLREIGELGGGRSPPHTGASLVLGLALLASGSAVVTLAAVRYQRTRSALERGEFMPARRLVTLTAAGAIAITIAMAIYLIVTAG